MKTLKLLFLTVAIAFAVLSQSKADNPPPTMDNLGFYLDEMDFGRVYTTVFWQSVPQDQEIGIMYNFGYASGVFSYLYNKNSTVLAYKFDWYTANTAPLPFALTPECVTQYQNINYSYDLCFSMFTQFGFPPTQKTYYLKWYVGFYQAIVDCINYNQ